VTEGFVYGRPVTGSQFVGREKIIRDIQTLIRSGQGIILIGPRGYGKTSVLFEVVRRLKHDYFTGNVDVFSVTTKKELANSIIHTTLMNKKISLKRILNFFKESFAKALSRVEVRAAVDEFEIILKAADKSTDEDALLNDALDFPENFSKKTGKKMVFAYDEFGDMLKINGNTIKRTRAKIQHHKNVVYLFAGSEESIMEHLFTKRSEAFYGFGKIMRLDPLSENDFIPYIVSTYKKLGIKINQDIVGGIVELVTGHPYYVNYLCQTIYLAVKGEKKKIESKDVERGYKNAVVSESTYFDKTWFELRNASLQAQIVKHLAVSNVSPYRVFDESRQNVYRALTVLEHKGIIRKQENRYVFINPLFKTYIQEMSQSNIF